MSQTRESIREVAAAMQKFAEKYQTCARSRIDHHISNGLGGLLAANRITEIHIGSARTHLASLIKELNEESPLNPPEFRTDPQAILEILQRAKKIDLRNVNEVRRIVGEIHDVQNRFPPDRKEMNR